MRITFCSTPSRWTLGLLLCVCTGAIAAGAGNLNAGPTSEDPELPLALWSNKHNETLYADTASLYKQTSKTISTMQKKLEARQVKSIKLMEIGKAHVAINQLERRGAQLAQWGEPAGSDFRLRGEKLWSELGPVIEAARPAFSEQIAKGSTVFRNRVKQKLKNLEAIKKLLDNEKFEEAESRLLPVIDDLDAIAIWYYTGPNRPSEMLPFDDAHQQIQMGLKKRRTEAAAAAIAAEYKKRLPDTDGLLKEVTLATAAVATTGKAKLDDQDLAGPELVARFGEKWLAAHLAFVQCVALDWARYDGEGKTELPKLAQKYAAFNQAVAAALAGLVKADAGRATAESAVDLSGRYAMALAPLLALGDAKTLNSSVAPALDSLAAKNPALAAYRGATSDLLRWRARTAASQAGTAQKEFNQLSSAPEFDSRLLKPAPVTCETASKQFMDKKVTLSNFVGRQGSQTTGGAVNNRFARAALVGFEDITAELAAQLLVTSTTPPLTLEAAAALDAMRRGDMAELGGVVSGVELEGLVPLYANIGPESWGLARLGVVPVTPPLKPAEQLRLRLDVQPKWLQGQYFFYRLPE